MKELGITKGEWKKHKINLKDYKVVAISSNAKNTVLAHLYLEDGEITKEHLANSDLIADAGTTANKCGMLPSELLERYNEAIEVLDGLLDDFKYYISQMDEEPQRAGYMLEAEQTISKAKP